MFMHIVDNKNPDDQKRKGRRSPVKGTYMVNSIQQGSTGCYQSLT